MKKVLSFAVIVLALAAILSACSSKPAKEISMYDLKNAMAGATSRFSEMTYASSEDSDKENIFTHISDMNYSKVNSFFIYYATNGTGNADELAVIEVKDSSDLSEARKSLEAHLETRKSLYSTYDKSQLKKLEAARIATNGNCAALIVGDEADKISDAFQNFINNN
ncbi:MAG: DUF4358 domain-containing protein [Eubacterium sp.]|nr:DUF4358 domain-containing protein [Eubacterium sp.]